MKKRFKFLGIATAATAAVFTLSACTNNGNNSTTTNGSDTTTTEKKETTTKTKSAEEIAKEEAEKAAAAEAKYYETMLNGLKSALTTQGAELKIETPKDDLVLTVNDFAVTKTGVKAFVTLSHYELKDKEATTKTKTDEIKAAFELTEDTLKYYSLNHEEFGYKKNVFDPETGELTPVTIGEVDDDIEYQSMSVDYIKNNIEKTIAYLLYNELEDYGFTLDDCKDIAKKAMNEIFTAEVEEGEVSIDLKALLSKLNVETKNGKVSYTLNKEAIIAAEKEATAKLYEATKLTMADVFKAATGKDYSAEVLEAELLKLEGYSLEDALTYISTKYEVTADSLVDAAIQVIEEQVVPQLKENLTEEQYAMVAEKLMIDENGKCGLKTVLTTILEVEEGKTIQETIIATYGETTVDDVIQMIYANITESDEEFEYEEMVQGLFAMEGSIFENIYDRAVKQIKESEDPAYQVLAGILELLSADKFAKLYISSFDIAFEEVVNAFDFSFVVKEDGTPVDANFAVSFDAATVVSKVYANAGKYVTALTPLTKNPAEGYKVTASASFKTTSEATDLYKVFDTYQAKYDELFKTLTKERLLDATDYKFDDDYKCVVTDELEDGRVVTYTVTLFDYYGYASNTYTTTDSEEPVNTEDISVGFKVVIEIKDGDKVTTDEYYEVYRIDMNESEDEPEEDDPEEENSDEE